jgi:hypothetical protein
MSDRPHKLLVSADPECSPCAPDCPACAILRDGPAIYALSEAERLGAARSVIPCALCGRPTLMLGTKRCDRCWELEGRIESDPDLARQILARVASGAAVAPTQEGA